MLKHFKRDSADLKEEEREALRLFDLNVLEQLDQQVRYFCFVINIKYMSILTIMLSVFYRHVSLYASIILNY